jgi:hypothetical protein
LREGKDMKLLAVIGSELVGGDERSDWAALNALVAVNGPEGIEVRVIAVVNNPRRSIAVGNPLGRSVAKMSQPQSGSGEVYNPSESARGRLDRALQYLRSLGVHASGDIEPGDAYRCVHRELAKGGYDRVLVLQRADASWSRRVFRTSLAARLRRSVHVPVDSLSHTDLSGGRFDGS